LAAVAVGLITEQLVLAEALVVVALVGVLVVAELQDKAVLAGQVLRAQQTLVVAAVAAQAQ
jgi:hypothetical protein